MRLLIADSEKKSAEELKTVLRHEGCLSDIVYNIKHTLEYLKTGNYDALILDIMMPEAHDSDIINAIRNAGFYLPILILTSNKDFDLKVRCLDAGANDYVTKPFHSGELLARIRVMTRNHYQPFHAILSIKNIALNRASHQLCSPEGQMILTNKEYQIMEILMCNPNHFIPAERLLEKVWGYESTANANVVWVQICNLRKKLTLLQSEVQIKALRNSGYRLEEGDH